MRFVVLFTLFFLHFSLCAQEVEVDTTALVKDTSHSVRKAVIYSAVLPGLGQIYNHSAMPKGKKKAFWKVPLIYGALGASGYFLVSNELAKNELKQEYLNRTEQGLYSTEWIQYDDQAILTLYNQHLTRRDLSILAVAGVYILQVIDAGVEVVVNIMEVEELPYSLNLKTKILFFSSYKDKGSVIHCYGITFLAKQ